MRLVLDFSQARQTRCHSYTGVSARIDDGAPRMVTITHDGCRSGCMAGPTTPCDEPRVDQEQAWSVAMLLTRDESVKPVGDPFWDAGVRRMSIPLRTSARPRIMC